LHLPWSSKEVIFKLADYELSSMPNESDGAAEPLISRHETENTENLDAGYDAESAALPGRFVWILTFAAALSGLLFGYEYVDSNPQCNL
jgi:hypothetical protein